MNALKNLNDLLSGSCEDLINDYLEEQNILELCPEYFEIIKYGSEHKIIRELNLRLKEVDCEIHENDLIEYVLAKISILAVRFLCEQPQVKCQTRKLTSF